ncbi:DUF4065 domain-containing protein [Sphingobacterium sp. N143]|uniref:Panacea domain-containing protein n=1 Tax=Sphingobacterium sp. N143 TaxID=2746727 RepID=UPI0025783D75|nr:type II toxin-antitoxin system antitoxin SocA domain-containing protein [Sphingobacterium sp. N143]MDM1295304.1 DUF4065 domain-containing protein [Sphingobacterium sp. N143]
MYSINAISDYIISACKTDGNQDLSVLKHQKLLYYVQAWYLAFNGKPAFDGKFEAWVHGPVNREIYNLYKDSHSIYAELGLVDIKTSDFNKNLDQDIINHLNSVLEVYASLSGSELEELTHREKPWLEARGGISPYQRCTNVLSEETMANYYRQRLNN